MLKGEAQRQAVLFLSNHIIDELLLMGERQTERIKDGFILGGFFIALLFLTLFIPGLEFMSLLILPIPIAIYGYRYGWQASLSLSLLIFFSISVLAYYFFIIS